MRQCLCIHITGRVQGVCFRYYAKMEADQLGVTGYTRNLSDGSVEALICGSVEQLDDMQRWLSHGPEMARVDHVRISKETPEHIPDDFRIALH
ncbi:MAG: acylphosphatase, partial [Mariprofundaceae bacterium]|nr:acylphosphatase [Mariprofundaceae bacterium]